MAHEQHITKLRDQYMPDGNFDESKYGVNNIEKETFTSLLSQYPNVVPSKLTELEHQRLEAIPATLKQRKDSPYLDKTELTTLMDWKLSHGKFRPMLKSLIKQNPADVVSSTTQEAFSIYTPPEKANLKRSITTLTALKGVGPATASLLLSVHDPTNVVFFADQVFRWACYEGAGVKGWNRPIKYSLPEYVMLAERVEGLRQRLGHGVRSLDVEMVGYVLGKIGEGHGSGVEKAGVGEREERKRKDSEEKGEGPAAKRGKITTPMAEGTDASTNRRSLRVRK